MNLKVTGALALAAVLVGAIAWSNAFALLATRLDEGSLDNYNIVQTSFGRFEAVEKKADKSPWFYQVSEDDIQTIAVRHHDKDVSFYKTELRTWAFTDPEGIPPSHQRWGGVTLLLSGPGTRRDLTAALPTIDDPAQYGLDSPDTIVDVGLTANRSLQFRLGDLTTDGRHHYGQVSGFPDLFLIASSWGDVISRLAGEPPVPKWGVERDPSIIVELNVYRGDPTAEATDGVSFIQDYKTGAWTTIDSRLGPEEYNLDLDVWSPYIAMVPGPDISVAEPAVDDYDYSPWGIEDDSRAIEIRFSGTTERGTRFTDGVLLRLGDKSDDGAVYYAKSESNFARQPVLALDAEWVDAFLDLSEDVPTAGLAEN